MIKYILVFYVFSFCQSNDDVKELVRSLSWESFQIAHATHSARIELIDSASQKLLQIGKPSSDELINTLSDQNKGVAAHLLLTKIWKPKEFNLKLEYVYKEDEVVMIKYTLNRLNWIWDISNESFAVSKYDLKIVSDYWHQTVKK